MCVDAHIEENGVLFRGVTIMIMDYEDKEAVGETAPKA